MTDTTKVSGILRTIRPDLATFTQSDIPTLEELSDAIVDLICKESKDKIQVLLATEVLRLRAELSNPNEVA